VLNQTPMWKYLVVFFVVAICALYASPNLYGEDNAVQISAGRNGSVDLRLLDRVNEELAAANIESKRVVLENNQILVRFTDDETQRFARDTLERALGGDYYA
jgi:preprotein translocase subunit SecD